MAAPSPLVKTAPPDDFAPLQPSGAAGPGALFRRTWTGLLDLLYPPQCLHCGAPVMSSDALCGPCFSQLRPISAPLCPRLGIPFAIPLGPGAVSAEALADPPPFERARAAVLYSKVAGALVSRLKYGDRPELARFCAGPMRGAGHELWTGQPVLVPVPLHRLRQFRRGYNQSLELARALAALTGLPVNPGLVRRKRATQRQVGLSGSARQRNVAGAFLAHPEAATRLNGRGVVIVDDVYTTGATVKAVTRALRRAGVEKIDVITFARVAVGAEAPI